MLMFNIVFRNLLTPLLDRDIGHEDTTQNVWHLGWELCRLMRAITTIIASADLHQDGNVILTPYTIHSHILIVVIVVLFAIHWHLKCVYMLFVCRL